MNKTAYLLAASIMLMTSAPKAYAAGQIYAKLGLNKGSSPSVNLTNYVPSKYQLNANSSLMPELALGYDWDNGFAVELSYQVAGGSMKEFTVNNDIHKITSGDVAFTSTMVKGIYNIQTNKTDFYNPYIGFGFGNTDTHSDKATYDHYPDDPPLNGSASSKQLTLGNHFKFNQDWFGDIAANYTRTNATTLTYSYGTRAPEKISSSSMKSLSFAVGKSF